MAALALVGAAALSGGAMQAPVAPTVLVLELSESVLVPLLATAIATTVAFSLDGCSVFSGRLTPKERV